MLRVSIPRCAKTALVGLLLSTLPSCKQTSDQERSSREGATPPPAAAPATLPPAPAPALPGDPPQGAVLPPQTTAPVITLQLKDAGQGAKRLLRYRFAPGKTKKFSMQMNLAMNATMDGQPGQPMPPVELEFKGHSLVLAVQPDGTAQRQTTFDLFLPKMPHLPPEMAARMAEEMKGAEGLQVVETINSRGQVQGVEVKQETIKSAAAQQLLGNLMEGMSNSFLPLPEEPVGLGATWESRSTQLVSGVPVTQVGSFKLAASQGDKITLELSIQQTADAQKVPSFESAPGVATQLVSMDGQGTGLTSVDLGRLDSSGSVAMETKTVTRLTSLPPPPAPGTAPPLVQPAPRSAVSTLIAKVGFSVKMTD